MRKSIAALACCGSLLALAAVPDRVKAENPAVKDSMSACRVDGIHIPGLKLKTAALVPDGPLPMFPGSPNGALQNLPTIPSHCLVEGQFEERVGAQGKPYAIAVQIRIPAAWNGRLIFQGGGGMNGFVGPAIGLPGGMASTAKPGLARGFAVVTTDSGHQGPTADFAADQLAKLNYAYASIGKVAILAKQVVEQVAGKRPDHTYYVGCSNGGREAMMAAQRFPEEFDGVVANNPAFNLGAAATLATFSTGVYRTGAPRGADGAPIVPLALLPAEAKLLSAGILKQCDGLDGAKDGFIFNHAACHFDPAVLQCHKGSLAGTCLPSAKVAMIRSAMAGPRDAAGKPLMSPWPYDGGVGSDGWRMWQMGGMGPDGKPMMGAPMLVADSLARYFHYPAVDPATLGSARSADLLKAIQPTASITDAVSTQMSTFSARGGKMLLVTGWSDPIFSPLDLERWYNQLDRDMTSASQTSAPSFARLFMIPGMTHCGGGPALDNYDALGALVDWVEQGKAPDSILATGAAYPGVSRPICAYPKIATYKQGPQSEASSYSCEIPKRVPGSS